jgi:hypothetical protein
MGIKKPVGSPTTILTKTQDTPLPKRPRPNKKPRNAALLVLNSGDKEILKEAKATKTNKDISTGEKESVSRVPAINTSTSPHIDLNSFTIQFLSNYLNLNTKNINKPDIAQATIF